MRKPAIILPATLLILSLLTPSSSAAQERTPLPGLSLHQAQGIIDAASGDLALNHIRRLVLHHRWFVSDGYLDAAAYVREQAEAAGLKDVKIERFPSDGKLFYSTDRTLPKWTVRSASLRMVSPTPRHLVSWDEAPIVLASNSRAADVQAELIDVGEGVQASDYEGKDVRGKLVLASSPQEKGRIETAHRLAVLERGAAGVISYRSYHLDDFPDLVTWDHIWTLALDGKQSTFGFCISKRMGWELQRLLRSGRKVVLQARVDADLSAGEYGVVTGLIPGTDPSGQEVWFVAHLDHTLPSANDNASGSAAILETARVLKSLLDSKALPQPRRTLRFLWVPEIRGSYAYISRHLEQTRRAVAVVNMDMVGENQELCGSVFRVTRTPDSTPSFLNDLLLWNLEFMLGHEIQPEAELTDPLAVFSPFGTRGDWRAAVIPYSEGSDHDVFMGGVVNVPATMLGSWPDNFYHSSGDTPDKSDPTQLKRAIVYGALLAASIAEMDGGSAQTLLPRMQTASRLRIYETLDLVRRGLESSELTGTDLQGALKKVRWTLHREARTLASLDVFAGGDSDFSLRLNKLTAELYKERDALEEQVHAAYREICLRRGIEVKAVPALTPEEEQARNLVPMRNPGFPGPISMEYVDARLPGRGRKLAGLFRGIEMYELGAFMDGTLNALEIRDAVGAECGPLRMPDVLDYLNTLSDAGLISYRKK
jgi:aminopeptidase YwaD